MNTAQAEPDVRGGRHRSPSLVAVAIVFVSLFVASLATVVAMTGGAAMPLGRSELRRAT